MKRKIRSYLDLANLKEVQAAGAHRAALGQTLVLFEEVGKHFNATGSVGWKADGNHYQDLCKRIIAKFRDGDAERAARYNGTEEEEQLGKIW